MEELITNLLDEGIKRLLSNPPYLIVIITKDDLQDFTKDLNIEENIDKLLFFAFQKFGHIVTESSPIEDEESGEMLPTRTSVWDLLLANEEVMKSKYAETIRTGLKISNKPVLAHVAN